jgi:hypothetical protein
MRHMKAPELNRYLIDTDGGVVLPVTLRPPILLFPFLLKNNDLFRPITLHDRAFDRDIRHKGRAYLEIAFVLNQQDFVERNFRPHVAGKLFQPNGLSGRHSVLFSA